MKYKFLLTISLLIGVVVVKAQEKPVLQLIPTEEKIILDGELDEQVWKDNESLLTLTMIEPNEGANSSSNTRLSVLASRKALIIGVYCYDDPSQIEWGIVAFDNEKCSSCGLCIKICPCDTLKMNDKKIKMKEIIECMACGDCVAFCPENAISLTRNYRYTGFCKTIGFGDLVLPRL